MTNTWQNGHLILFPSLLIIVLLNFLLIVLLDLLKKNNEVATWSYECDNNEKKALKKGFTRRNTPSRLDNWDIFKTSTFLFGLSFSFLCNFGISSRIG
jgi:high-affinity nickel permease